MSSLLFSRFSMISTIPFNLKFIQSSNDQFRIFSTEYLFDMDGSRHCKFFMPDGPLYPTVHKAVSTDPPILENQFLGKLRLMYILISLSNVFNSNVERVMGWLRLDLTNLTLTMTLSTASSLAIFHTPPTKDTTSLWRATHVKINGSRDFSDLA